MIDLQCKCGYRFRVGDEARGLTADCPHCGQEVPVDFPDQQTVVGVGQSTVPPSPRTVIAEPMDLEELKPLSAEEVEAATKRTLSRGLRLADLTNAIEQPRISYSHDLLRSFQVLFTGSNKGMLLRLAAMDAWILLVAMVAMGATYLQPPLVMVVLLPIGWHCAVYFRVVEAGCAGQDDLRIAGIENGVWEDLFVPLVRFFATVWLASMPLWAYWLIIAALPGPPPPVTVDLVLLCVSLFVWPATVLTLVMGDSVLALMPQNIFRMITGAFLPYMALWLGMLLFGGLGIAAGWLVWNLSHDFNALALILLVPIYSITGLLMMRAIGLMYRHFKASLPFAAE